MKTTFEAITARLLQGTPESLEWGDLRRQLYNEKPQE